MDPPSSCLEVLFSLVLEYLVTQMRPLDFGQGAFLEFYYICDDILEAIPLIDFLNVDHLFRQHVGELEKFLIQLWALFGLINLIHAVLRVLFLFVCIEFLRAHTTHYEWDVILAILPKNIKMGFLTHSLLSILEQPL